MITNLAPLDIEGFTGVLEAGGPRPQRFAPPYALRSYNGRRYEKFRCPQSAEAGGKGAGTENNVTPQRAVSRSSGVAGRASPVLADVTQHSYISLFVRAEARPHTRNAALVAHDAQSPSNIRPARARRPGRLPP